MRNPDVAEIENTRESIECDVEVYSTIESILYNPSLSTNAISQSHCM